MQFIFTVRLMRIVATVFAATLVLPAGRLLAQQTCPQGEATANLDIGNVRAALYNNGNLFWNGARNLYNVPQTPEGTTPSPSAVFVAQLWIAGMIGDTLAQAAATKGGFYFRPGPLDAAGNPPSDCSPFDRIYVVSRADVDAYDSGEEATPDLAEWPVEQGAPVIDGDGRPGNYDLRAGDRPALVGDQMAYWVMHANTVVPFAQSDALHPMPIEVRATAYAFDIAGDIGNTTFYTYQIVYKGDEPFRDAWVGVFADVDLGMPTDDYVGSDSTLNLGYSYNADNDDEGIDGYGSPPPAVGFRWLQGPLVPSSGQAWVDPDGAVHPDSTRRKLERFGFWNSNVTANGDPRSGTNDFYNYLRGYWQDGSRWCVGSNGFADLASFECTGEANYLYPGDPVRGEFWSELNIDNMGQAAPPSDRRMLLSSGPFDMERDDSQEISFAIVWARGEDNLDSVTRVKQASVVADNLYRNNSRFPQGPDAPELTTTESDGAVTLLWSNGPTSNNADDSYSAHNPLLADTNAMYEFEGYEVFSFDGPDFDFATAELIAVFDLPNGVTEVRESDRNGSTEIVARGTDSGVQHSLQIDGLTNYSEHYYGVRAYAYGADTEVNRIIHGPIVTTAVIPTRSPAEVSLEDIGIVPNPYRGASVYEVARDGRTVRFTNMPEVATVRVFTLSGSLVATLAKSGPERFLEWDLSNDFGRTIGSGVYLVHVDVPNVGSRVIKFGVVVGDRAVQLQ